MGSRGGMLRPTHGRELVSGKSGQPGAGFCSLFPSRTSNNRHQISSPRNCKSIAIVFPPTPGIQRTASNMFRNALRQSTRAVGAISASSRVAAVSPSSPLCLGLLTTPPAHTIFFAQPSSPATRRPQSPPDRDLRPSARPRPGSIELHDARAVAHGSFHRRPAREVFRVRGRSYCLASGWGGCGVSDWGRPTCSNTCIHTYIHTYIHTHSTSLFSTTNSWLSLPS